MLIADHIIDLPDSVLDWFRFTSAILGAYFCGMAIFIAAIYHKHHKEPVYHVRWIAAGNVIFVGALVYAELGLIGQPQTRVSWVVAIGTIVGLIPMVFALHSLLRSISYER